MKYNSKVCSNADEQTVYRKLNVKESTHSEIKVLAAQKGVSMVNFVDELVKSYKGGGTV